MSVCVLPIVQVGFLDRACWSQPVMVQVNVYSSAILLGSCCFCVRLLKAGMKIEFGEIYQRVPVATFKALLSRVLLLLTKTNDHL